MYKATLINAEYISSNRKLFQGTRSELQSELNKGWEVAGGSNGTYVLVKPAQAIFVFKTIYGIYRYNMREEILNYLKKQRLTEKSFEIFKRNLKAEKFLMYIDENGYYTLR